MKKPELSIVIPALNEEKNIGKLLESVKAQRFPCEIIVADAGSKDKTVEIAKSYGARIVKGGLPAVGRNNGARVAKSDPLLFLDADVLLQESFLKFCFDEIKKKKLGVATCYGLPLSKNILDIIAFEITNLWMEMFKRLKPYARGFCIFASRKVHNRIEGFDESLRYGEDFDYIKRATKIAKFDVLDRVVFTSVRRFEKEGRIKCFARFIYLAIYRLFMGEMKKDANYQYNHYD